MVRLGVWLASGLSVGPMTFEERAPAKVNLSLRVVGRRPDGYHEIDSLVAFADTGDTLTLEPGPSLTLETSGDFASAIDDGNLVLQAAERVLSLCPGTSAGAFSLVKRLPVAAGLGGGSADAAAALRALQRLNGDLVTRHQMLEIAHDLGADVAVCLDARPALMRGIGTQIEPLAGVPAVPAVLVNPRVELSTAAVYGSLDAPALPAGFRRSQDVPAIASPADLIRFTGTNGNDLQAPAMALAPEVAEALKQLADMPGCGAAAMSGSGATCFGLFEDTAQALEASAQIARAAPHWWVEKTRLG